MVPPMRVARYDTATSAEACLLENVWRRTVFRSQCVSLSLVLYRLLPLCLVRHIVCMAYPRRVVVNATRVEHGFGMEEKEAWRYESGVPRLR